MEKSINNNKDKDLSCKDIGEGRVMHSRSGK